MKKFIPLLFLFLSVSAFGQSLDFSGYFKFFAHPNLNSPHNFDRLGTRFQTNLFYSMNDNVAFFTSLDFNFEESTGLSDVTNRKLITIIPVEGYIDFYWDNFDLRIGKQFIFWGTGDWVNPTDNINPWDYVNISAEIEDYRIAVTSAKADYYLGDLNLEGVWIFQFRPNVIPMEIPGQIGDLTVNNLGTTLPGSNLKNTEFAFRLSSNAMNIDYSLSYFNGFDKFPTNNFTFIPQPQPQLNYSTIYNRLQVFGADFITTFDKFAVLGEGAYYLTKDKDGNDPFIQNPYIYYVLGVNYTPVSDLLFNLQLVQKILTKYDETEERRLWEEIGFPDKSVPQQITNSISGRVQYDIGSYTTLQFITVVNLEDWDYFLLPIFNYEVSDGLNLYFGATIFQGDENTTFGRNKKYSRGFFEIKYSFAM